MRGGYGLAAALAAASMGIVLADETRMGERASKPRPIQPKRDPIPQGTVTRQQRRAAERAVFKRLPAK